MKNTFCVILFLIVCLSSEISLAQFTQQGSKLFGTGAIGDAFQGSSVSISADGNTAVEGGSFDNSNAGAVWVFTRIAGAWTQQGTKLLGTGFVGSNIYLGCSVGISADGNTIVAAGQGDNNNAGAVWVFTRSAGVWTQQGSKLVGPGSVGNALQGHSVGISGDGNTIIVGGERDNNNAGAVWIFTRSAGVWTQQGGKLVGSGAVGSLVYQGCSVSISADGNTIVEGGRNDNNNAGAVWVFTRSAGVWTQSGPKLVGSGATGSIVCQGTSVAISSDGNTFVEGANLDNSNIGAVWVFSLSGGVWTQQGSKLVGSGAAGNSQQGISVAISSDGNTFIEGGDFDNSNAGAVWTFIRNSGAWTQLGSKFSGSGAVGAAFQGASVAASSDCSTIIESGDADNNSAGAVWVFVYPGIGITPISAEVPKEFQLMQNYPNPFNPSTKIKFQIAKAVRSETSNVKLIVYDLAGREVAKLVNEQLAAGTYEIDFDASKFASGVYFYKLTAGDYSETKRMILVK